MLKLITKRIKETYDNSYLKLFADNIRTKDGRENISHFLLGTLFEKFSFLASKKRADKYLERLRVSLMSDNKCVEAGVCANCSCKVPDMFWVKDCKGKCNGDTSETERSNSSFPVL